MATIFTHAIVAGALGQGVGKSLRCDWRFWYMTVLCSILPDFDVVAFRFGIAYGALWGHRGMTHSILVAVVIGVLASLRFYKKGDRFGPRIGLAFFFTLVTASHSILDAMTNGGLGVAFFSPFDTTRYFFPWQPIEVSSIGASFFSARAWPVIQSELIWLVIPSLVIGVLLRIIRRKP